MTLPEVTSYSLGTRFTSEDFPLAVGPMTATVSPGEAENVTCDSTSRSVPGYVKLTSSKRTSPWIPVSGAPGPSVTDGSCVTTSSMRLEDTMTLGRPRRIPVDIITAEITCVAYDVKTTMSENRDICSACPPADWMRPAPIQYMARIRKFIMEEAMACIGDIMRTWLRLLSRSLPLASASLASCLGSAL